MRAVDATRWFLCSVSLAALAAVFAPERAYAACPGEASGEGIIQINGASCTLTPGVYGFSGLTVAPVGVGFFAATGGMISATGFTSITINTPNSGVEANDGVISLTNDFTRVITANASAYGFYAQNGGQITLGAVPPSLANVVTSGSGAFGLYATGAGSTITAYATAIIQTSGASADGVVAEADGSVSLASGGQVTTGVIVVPGTSPATAVGVLANTGGQVTLTGVSVTTSGAFSPGIEATGGDGGGGHSHVTTFVIPGVNGEEPTLPTPTTVATSGDHSPGVDAESGGQVSLNGASVATSGAFAPGILATGGDGVTQSVVTTAVVPGVPGDPANPPIPTTVATTGDNSPGVRANSGGQVRLNGGAVMTSGTGSPGLYATGVDGTTGAKSIITATGVAITTGANPGPGTGAVGVLAEAGGQAFLTGGSVTTNGNSAYGVVAQSGGSGGLVQLNGTSISTNGNGSGGLGINGAGSEIDATNVTISTIGGSDSSTGQHSYGVYNGPYMSFTAGGVANLTDTSVSTQGYQMHGVNTSTGGSTTILGGSITTAGFDANAIYTQNGGITTVGVSATGPTTLATTGNDAYAVVAVSGGFVSLTGSQISTATGTIGSGGIAVHDAGSEVDATNVSITTLGGFDSETGRGAYGLYNGPFGESESGGVAKLTNSTIATSGDQMFAVITLAGGSTTISGGSLTTLGLGASGVVTEGGGLTSVNGALVSTRGQDAHALFVAGSGSQANLGGTNTFVTQGAGATGLYATAGGRVTATGPVTITTGGGVSPATSLGAFGVNADGAGSQINLASTTITTSGAGATGLFASDAASTGAGGSITVAGTLTLKTTNAAATGIVLQGNGASISATGGGSINAASDAIDFLGGTNQVATFDNFTIANATGNLIFSDPSVSTVNFNNTTANAGTNNLLDATNGSMITLNANASALTGAIQTDSASTSIVNLINGSVWNVTGSSAVSSLTVTNSAIIFAPPGSFAAFKTVTVGSYSGSGASLTMNTFLAGTGSKTDQLVINGGTGPGTTFVTINNPTINGAKGPGAQTTGNGIQLITVNGGTAAGSFALANTPVAGGFRYSLQDDNNDWYLVSTPTSTPADIQNSVNNLARSQLQQIITNRVLGSILLGATEQVNCSNCSSGFGSIGSYALGAHGRHSLSDELTVMGGFSYGEYSADGVTVSNAPTVAGSLVYDFVNWGRSRPFVEVGGGATPFEDVQYSRTYANGASVGTGYGKAINRNLAIFGRVGWVDRVTPIDEAAIYGDISRNWMVAGGYTEAAGPVNPYPATVQSGLDTLNVARVGGQYTHLFNGNIEVNVSAAVAYGFDSGSGNSVNVYDFGTISPYPIGNSFWLEYGGRVGYRLGGKMVLDAFLLGTAGGEIGRTLHGGIGLRYLF
jgi:fibronectin-binding autotransporter adhesin